MEHAAAQAGTSDAAGADAEAGTSLHAQIAEAIRQRVSGFAMRLSDMDELVEKCVAFFEEQRAAHPPTSFIHVEEQRVMVGIDPVVYAMVGTPDVCWVSGRRAVVIDWKTGHDRDYDASVQMSGYAALLGMPTVAYVFNPRFGLLGTYEVDGAEERRQWRAFHVDVSKPDAPVTPGAHCDWCPAKSSCPALLAVVETPNLPTIAESIDLATPEQRARWGERLPVVEAACAALKAAIRRDKAADPASHPAWEIRTRNGSRSADALALFERLVNATNNLTLEEYMGCLSVSVAEAERRVVEKARAGGMKKKDAEAAFRELTGDLVKQGATEALYFTGAKEVSSVW